MNKILIVEDEERVSDIQKAYSEKERYEVYTSTTGLKALELFDSIEFNLVILDLMLPDIQGEEICKIIWSYINPLYTKLRPSGKIMCREVFFMGRKQYSRDFKIGAINQVIQEGKSVSKVAKELELENEILKKFQTFLQEQNK